MSSKARTEDCFAREVTGRLSRAGDEGHARLAHIESVVRTIRELVGEGDWSSAIGRRAERAGWTHDVLRTDDPAALRERIEAAGEEPDPWALAHAPVLLHAQAAAVWAAERGESDPEVLLAVRHHPTAHPDWGPVGLLLYVADFCEPGRSYAERLGTHRFRRRAVEGDEGLREAARHVLALRLSRDVERSRPIHPLTTLAWNRWLEVAP